MDISNIYLTKAMQLEIAETSVGAGHKFPK